MYTDRQMDARKNTNCKPWLSPEQARARMGAQGSHATELVGCSCCCCTNIESWKVEQQLQQNRSSSLLREGGAGTWTALSIHGCWKGAISESPIISHTCTVFTYSRQKTETHRPVLEERFEILFWQRNFPIISVTYTKNPSATANRKDTVRTSAGCTLTRPAAAMRLNLSFKSWNLTCKKGYSACVWRVLDFTGPLLLSEWRSHSNSQTVLGLSFSFLLIYKLK